MSLLFQNFINEHENVDKARAFLKNKGIDSRFYRNCADSEDGLLICKYKKGVADMTDPLVQASRGLIFTVEGGNLKELKVVPPIKAVSLQAFFGTSTDDEVLNVVTGNDENGYLYQEFVDGTNFNMFYHNGKWEIATRSCIGGRNTWMTEKTFKEMVEETMGANYEGFNTNYCYNFVLCHKDNRIVVRHNTSHVVLVDVYEIAQNVLKQVPLVTVQAQLAEHSTNVRLPKTYQFGTLNEAYDFTLSQRYNFQGLIIKKRFNSLDRTRIRNPQYTEVRELRGQTNQPIMEYLRLRKTRGHINKFLKVYPEYRKQFQTFRDCFHNLTDKVYACYMNVFVHRELKHSQLKQPYKDLCYKLHSLHLKNRKPTTFNVVMTFINNLDIQIQLNAINCYQKSTQVNVSKADIPSSGSNVHRTLEPQWNDITNVASEQSTPVEDEVVAGVDGNAAVDGVVEDEVNGVVEDEVNGAVENEVDAVVVVATPEQ